MKRKVFGLVFSIIITTAHSASSTNISSTAETLSKLQEQRINHDPDLVDTLADYLYSLRKDGASPQMRLKQFFEFADKRPYPERYEFVLAEILDFYHVSSAEDVRLLAGLLKNSIASSSSNYPPPYRFFPYTKRNAAERFRLSQEISRLKVESEEDKQNKALVLGVLCSGLGSYRLLAMRSGIAALQATKDIATPDMHLTFNIDLIAGLYCGNPCYPEEGEDLAKSVNLAIDIAKNAGIKYGVPGFQNVFSHAVQRIEIAKLVTLQQRMVSFLRDCKTMDDVLPTNIWNLGCSYMLVGSYPEAERTLLLFRDNKDGAIAFLGRISLAQSLLKQNKLAAAHQLASEISADARASTEKFGVEYDAMANVIIAEVLLKNGKVSEALGRLSKADEWFGRKQWELDGKVMEPYLIKILPSEQTILALQETAYSKCGDTARAAVCKQSLEQLVANHTRDEINGRKDDIIRFIRAPQLTEGDDRKSIFNKFISALASSKPADRLDEIEKLAHELLQEHDYKGANILLAGAAQIAESTLSKTDPPMERLKLYRAWIALGEGNLTSAHSLLQSVDSGLLSENEQFQLQELRARFQLLNGNYEQSLAESAYLNGLNHGQGRASHRDALLDRANSFIHLSKYIDAENILHNLHGFADAICLLSYCYYMTGHKSLSQALRERPIANLETSSLVPSPELADVYLKLSLISKADGNQIRSERYARQAEQYATETGGLKGSMLSQEIESLLGRAH